MLFRLKVDKKSKNSECLEKLLKALTHLSHIAMFSGHGKSELCIYLADCNRFDCSKTTIQSMNCFLVTSKEFHIRIDLDCLTKSMRFFGKQYSCFYVDFYSETDIRLISTVPECVTHVRQNMFNLDRTFYKPSKTYWSNLCQNQEIRCFFTYKEFFRLLSTCVVFCGQGAGILQIQASRCRDKTYTLKFTVQSNAASLGEYVYNISAGCKLFRPTGRGTYNLQLILNRLHRCVSLCNYNKSFVELCIGHKGIFLTFSKNNTTSHVFFANISQVELDSYM